MVSTAGREPASTLSTISCLKFPDLSQGARFYEQFGLSTFTRREREFTLQATDRRTGGRAFSKATHGVHVSDHHLAAFANPMPADFNTVVGTFPRSTTLV